MTATKTLTATVERYELRHDNFPHDLEIAVIRTFDKDAPNFERVKVVMSSDPLDLSDRLDSATYNKRYRKYIEEAAKDLNIKGEFTLSYDHHSHIVLNIPTPRVTAFLKR
jgi:hypothetical protein